MPGEVGDEFAQRGEVLGGAAFEGENVMGSGEVDFLGGLVFGSPWRRG